jgi:hypothetical protein
MVHTQKGLISEHCLFHKYGGGMNYIEEEYIINEEGMIVEEMDKMDDHALNRKADPQNITK